MGKYGDRSNYKNFDYLEEKIANIINIEKKLLPKSYDANSEKNMNISIIEKSVNETYSCLYEEDFFLWLETTAQLLKEGKLNELDILNLVEEIEAMGRSEKRSVSSNLEVLLMHLLKYKYQPQKRTNSWRLTIFEHRNRVIEALEESPSLKRYYQEKLLSCYQKARKMASIETGLNINIFPENCPFELDLILDSDYLPE